MSGREIRVTVGECPPIPVYTFKMDLYFIYMAVSEAIVYLKVIVRLIYGCCVKFHVTSLAYRRATTADTSGRGKVFKR